MVCSRVSDEAGSLETSLVAEGDLTRDLLDPSDVFIADTGKELFVWIGGGASPDEKKNAMPYAHVSHKCNPIHAVDNHSYSHQCAETSLLIFLPKLSFLCSPAKKNFWCLYFT